MGIEDSQGTMGGVPGLGDLEGLMAEGDKLSFLKLSEGFFISLFSISSYE